MPVPDPSPSSGGPRWVGSAELTERLRGRRAVDLLAAALAAGLDPGADPIRQVVSAGAAGQLLLMPASTGAAVGVKVTSVAPANPARGRPRIQAIYVLMDAKTLTPHTILDGSALTLIRTAAVSALAVDRLAGPDAARLVVFGTGPQAWSHIEALRAVRPVERVIVVGRTPARTEHFLSSARAREAGFSLVGGEAHAVRDADLVLCATASPQPLFDGELVADGACVVAIGSHEADRRELDGPLMGRAHVVVEEVAAALREAGDVILAVAEGQLRAEALHGIRDVLLSGWEPDGSRPVVFKSVGMAWEDLVLAAACAEGH